MFWEQVSATYWASAAGFLLGDGRLNYDRETFVEAYYNLHVWPSARFHLEF